MGGTYYYCNPPCRDEVTDLTSCSEDNEDDYKCTGCQQVSPPTCGTYRDYTGLEISTCYDGCGYDWNSSDEICYEVKDCFFMFHPNSWCLECEGEMSCFPVIESPGGEEDCETSGECIVNILCDLAVTCIQCESDPENDPVIITVRKETCECN
jgi:hypothetical protein